MMAVITPLLPVILPVLICAAVGMLWARSGQPFDQDFVRRLVMWIGAPALIVGTLSEVIMPAEELLAVFRASLTLLLVSGVIAAPVCLLLRLPLRDFLVPLVFGNFGNMGLPLCLFAFGEPGLAIALGVFVITSLTHFSVGVAILNGAAAARGLLTSPIVYASVLACVMVLAGWQLPRAAANTLGILGDLTVPLMLITLGVSLGSLRLGGMGQALMLACLRLAVGIAAGFATVYLLDLQGLMRKVLLLQAATPAAVFNYLLALQYRRRPEAVAGMVLWSTLLSFITIPLLLHFIGLE